jgi:YVTN family beta-propeller protein
VGYELGVDLGGTAVAAAVATDSRVELVHLGDDEVTAPAVVFLDDDGSLIAGEAAARRGVEHPDRVGRELIRRLGSPAPVRLGDTAHPPSTLVGVLLQDVVNRVAEARGSTPDRVLLTHPAHWSSTRLDAFTEVIRSAGLPGARTVTEPEAVVAHYAATGRVAEGDTVAAYSLGGGTFSAAVLRRTATGIEPLGRPEGIERLGGGTFDEAILSHVNRAADGPLAGLDRRDPEHAAAVAGLRQHCLLAKEALSTDDTTVTIPVRLPNRQTEVTLTRAEFEQLIRTSVETTIGALLKALQSAEVEPRELAAVLLVGGSSRIPLVARMLTDTLARPIVLDPDPKRPFALGAATLAAAATDTADPAPRPAGPATGTEPAEPRYAGPPQAVTATAEPQRPAWMDAGTPQAEPAEAEPRPGVPEPASTVPVQRDRAREAPVAAAAGTRAPAPERPSAGSRSAAHPISLFEPFEPLDPVGSGPGRSPAGAAAGSAVAAPSAPSPDRSPPSFLAGETTVIPTPTPTSTPSPSAPAPRRSGPPPSRPAAGPGGSAPAGSPPPAPAAAPGADSPRRRRLAVLLAVVLVAALAGVGYLAWARVSTAPVAAPTAPVAPEAPAPAAASVPVPDVGPPVPVGETPGFVAVSPDGRRALVANQAAGVVTVVDTATNAVTARVPVPTGPPQYLTFSPDGRRAYVSIWNQARTVAAVGVLDTETNQFVATIPVRTRPYLSAVTPDGQRLYVPNHDSGTISVIDTGTNTVTAEITVAPNPHWVEMSADGTRAYAANHESNLVSVIDTADYSILTEVPVQTSPHSLAVHPTRPLVANVNYDSASVTMIDTNTDEVVATIPVGANPQDISWAPDGRHAYVANTTDNTVSVIDAETATVTATIPVGNSPTSVAVRPDGRTAYVSDLEDGTLAVLNIAG